MALADLLTEIVTVARNNARGDLPAAAELAASVQPLSASRVNLLGLEAGSTAFRVFLAADPGLHAGDTLERASGAVLQALAPARDEAGRGEVFAVDCVSID